MIKNAGNGKKLQMKYEIADTLEARASGLMFAPSPKCILFKFEREGHFPIHSFFVFFPFDAVYLDGKMRAREIFEGIAPFTPLVSPKGKARFLLELPQGSVRKLGLKVGDKVEVR